MNNLLKLGIVLVYYLCFTNVSYAHHTSGGGAGLSLNTTTNTLTLHKKEWLFESFFQLRNYRYLSNNQLLGISQGASDVTNLKSVGVSVLRGSYGLTDKLTITLQQPLFYTNSGVVESHEQVGIPQNNNKTNYFIGDPSVMSNWLLLNNKKRKIQLLGILGAELPVVKQRKSSSQLTTNSNSFDPIIGLMANKKWTKISLVAGASYKKTTTNSLGRNYGDVFTHSIYLFKKIGKSPVEVCAADSDSTSQCCTAPEPKYSWVLFVDVRGEYLHSQKKKDRVIQNTGYYQNFIGAGVNLSINKKISIPLSIELPIYQSINGYQNRTSLNMRVSISILI